MKAIRRFTVRTVLPESLAAVSALAANLRWSWHEPTKALFARIDPERWDDLDHDPVALLGAVDPARLDELAADPSFMAEAEALRADLTAYLEQPRWYQSLPDAPERIAYFSPEFGIARRFRSTRVASAFSPATTSRARATSACRLSVLACSTAPATSARRLIATAGRKRPTRSSIPTACPCRFCASTMAARCASR